MTRNERIPHALTSVAAFLLPGLALWVRSGYSYAAVLLLLGGVCFLPRWIRIVPDWKTSVLTLIFIAMGGMWLVLSLDQGMARWDKGSKWILGAFCLVFIGTYRPRLEWFIAGLPFGCIGMGVTALWQALVQEKARANGYTNAIQWGNTGMLLACLAAVCLVVYWSRFRVWRRILMFLAVLAALIASLLSESRGGWLAPVAVVPLGLLLARRIAPEKFKALLMALTAVLVAFLAIIMVTPTLHDRSALAVHEIREYLYHDKGNTSLGVRVQQYQLVADLIPQKPWLGWGPHGYVNEMKRRVEAGEYSSKMLHYPQVHNDLLDVWVKVGLLGVLLQGALYGWVLYLFWPTVKRLARFRAGSRQWSDALAVRVMGCLVPVCYLIFGMTQPFFNHNSGIMTYVFYVMVLWGALLRVEDADVAENRQHPAGSLSAA